jgi:hypothetical protein
VLLRDVLLAPSRSRDQLVQEHSAEALFGSPIPPSLAGVLPTLSPDDPTTFLGVLLAAADRRRMIESFDEDWFQSPHAAAALRDEDASLGTLGHTTAAALEAGLAELCRTLAELL